MSKKHTVGRPLKYTEAETMNYKIEEYFNSCFIPARDKNGDFLRDEKRKYNKNTNKTIYNFWIS